MLLIVLLPIPTFDARYAPHPPRDSKPRTTLLPLDTTSARARKASSGSVVNMHIYMDNRFERRQSR